MLTRLAFVALAMTPLTSHGAARESVLVPWQPGNADAFQMGAPEERGARAAQGSLPTTLYRPPGDGPFSFVVLLHGCGGLRQEAMWSRWVEPWAELLLEQRIGVAVVDSFAPRGVEQVCTRGAANWAVRRADDAYSAHAWLRAQPFVDSAHVAVMGMSNGGRTVLAALRTSARHEPPFAVAIALYPGCQSDVTSRLYAPLLVLIGRADTVTPAYHCERMKASQPNDAPPLTLVLYPRAPHTFDMPLPDRTVLGMSLGYDADALADARRQVIEFLAANGFVASRR